MSEKGVVATTATTAVSTGDTGSGSPLAPFGSAECQRAALTMSQAMTATVSGSGTAANFDEAGKTLRAAGDAAPSEIKASMGTLANAFAELYDRLAKVGYDPKAGQAGAGTAVAPTSWSVSTPARENRANRRPHFPRRHTGVHLRRACVANERRSEPAVLSEATRCAAHEAGDKPAAAMT